MKTKKEIVISLLENKHITFDEALTLLEKDYPPSNFIGYSNTYHQGGINNPYTVPYVVTCNSNLSNGQ